MVEKKIIIENDYGIHARPARLIVETASRFESDIQIVQDGKSVNAKSIMGILMLGAKKGTVLVLLTNGSDEIEAMEAVMAVFRKIASMKELQAK